MESENGQDIFQELLEYHHAEWSCKLRYTRLNSLLDRMTKQLTADFAAEYTSLYSRLFVLCRQSKYPFHRSIEIFRLQAHRVMRSDFEPDPQSYLFDLKALCEFVSFFYGTPVPLPIQNMLPEGWRELPSEKKLIPYAKQIRLITDHWDEGYIYGHDEQEPQDILLKVDYSAQKFFQPLKDQIHTGTQLNLLDVKVQIGKEEDANGEIVYLPRLIVLEPDFLIDISTLSACMEPYGTSALNYLVQKFKSRTTTDAILLGNAANQFLDDLVNEDAQHPASWKESICRNFQDDPLDYSVCEKIDKDYFDRSRQQFQNLQKVVQEKFGDASVDITRSKALLEPSFFSEALGLQGRMDLLLSDYSRIIELKSGKAEEFGSPRAKAQHALQMALYQELLYYSLDHPRDQVRTFLLYSKYPHLFEQRSFTPQIQEAIALRNAIVYQEQQLRQGKAWEILSALTPESFNLHQLQNNLWKVYKRPELEQFLQVFHRQSPLEAAYFNRFTEFVEREQFLQKMGDEQPDSGRGFAETWRADLLTKQANGNILTDLTIHSFHKDRGIDCILLNIPNYDEGFLPNFREGDAVILYQRNHEKDLATNHLVHRGILTRIEPDILELKLNYQQRNPIVFPEDSLYALEHDHMDATTATLYRGLYAFLKAPQDRKDLLLCQRLPQRDATRTLQGKYLNKNIDQIVLQAKQAQDYFLLVGPPGTGKTSIALSSMVQEFYADPSNNILLLSYTNRAVDEICEMLDSIPSSPLYIRIGHEQNCDPRFRKHLLKYQAEDCNSRSRIIQLFQRHRIIVGTVASLSAQTHTLFLLKHFQVAIFDEASQILEPHLLGLLSATDAQGKCAIEKFILIGDHKQLPAVVVQRPEQSVVSDEILQDIGLTDRRNSLFERLYAWIVKQDIPFTAATLLRQGRMHPDVCKYANEHFYQGELLPVPVPHQKQPLEFAKHGTDLLEYVATTRFGFIHCDAPANEENNKSNEGEARIVAAIVGSIYRLCQMNNLEFQASKRIGIIVPFRGQIARIRKELALLNIPETREIVIDTVERFQGSQRDIMIFSTTISQPYQLNILSAPVLIDGQWVDRKLNVALTRAKKQMFIVGNAHLLSRNPLYKDLIKTD